MRRLERLHDRIVPLRHFTGKVVPPEQGGYPTELWGTPETLARRQRRNLEKCIGAILWIFLSGHLVDALWPDISGWTVLLVIAAMAGPPLVVILRAAIELNRSDEQLVERISRKTIRKDPAGLHLEWRRCWELRETIDETLEEEIAGLTEAEAEVARTLATEHPGSIRELCQVARELCRQGTPTG